MKRFNVLLWDTDQGNATLFERTLKAHFSEIFQIETTDSGDVVLERCKNKHFDILIAFFTADFEVVKLVKQVKSIDSEMFILVATSYRDHPDILSIGKMGVDEVVPIPVSEGRMVDLFQSLIDNDFGKNKREIDFSFYGLVGTSMKVLDLFKTLDIVAQTNSPVLIVGESGTGKKAVANCIHRKSPRNQEPFLMVDCSKIPEAQLESTLFGHRLGAFSGADQNKQGLFENAHCGTVFLNMVDKLSYQFQSKLLRVLQEKRFHPLGSTEFQPLDIRIVAATSRDLREEVEKGLFREDLFYRLKTIPIQIPPLRDRREDIPLLVDHFIEKHGVRLGNKVHEFSKELLDALMHNLKFPGNIRELENIVHWILLYTDNEVVRLEDVPPQLFESFENAPDVPLQSKVEEPEVVGNDLFDGLDWQIMGLNPLIDTIKERTIRRAIEKANGNKSKAARLLQIPLVSLNHYVKKFSI